jgi:hypothetical protein
VDTQIIDKQNEHGHAACMDVDMQP